MKFVNIFTLFSISLLIITVHGYETKFTLEDVKQMKVPTCKEDSDCDEEYHLKCLIPDDKMEGNCISKFFCHSGDKCVYEVDKTIENSNTTTDIYVSYEGMGRGSIFSFYKTPTLILESCNAKDADLDICDTRTCVKNEECYSGICKNNICITNEKKPLYICSNDVEDFQNEDEANFEINSYTCKLAEQEICKKDTDCASNKCMKTESKEKLCIISYDNSYVIIYEIVAALLLFILCLCFIRTFLRRKAHNKVKKDVRMRCEMDEAFLHSGKKYVELEDIEEYDVDRAEKNLYRYN
ncbi:hypothetical protein BCR32DRAFT_273485 [Anaeromyces robustus]|uniref:Dickkopf N-terminal cysteine-rich domain-containing protein n=1 Tax=Anaeromyces robustus TaxID=1754192 RepID=A0A1Y1VPN2_9FUNG|nr:hypothetical protein BCR32DRAFT_273485 [Anaeromyces robustus]|eukprot:ORX63270.1 hypothetical protein BCR32DRAFT_273485 [Anaeromyces robustus]